MQEASSKFVGFSKKWNCPYSQAIQRIAEGKLDGYIAGENIIGYLKHTSKVDCRKLKVHKLGYSYMQAFPFAKNSPYREVIDRAIHELREQGTLQDLEDARRMPNCAAERIPKQVDMSIYIALFAVLVLLTCIILLAECVAYKCRGRFFRSDQRVIVV